MKISLLTGISAAAMVLAVSQASAADVMTPSPTFVPYVSIFAGASFPQNIDGLRSGSLYTESLNTGYLIGGTIGAEWYDTVRTEIELSHSYNSGNAFGYAPTLTSGNAGNLSATYLLGNVWLDWKNSSPFTPYVGGGVGVAFTNFDQPIPAGHGFSGSDTVLAYQLGAGVNYALSDAMSLDVGYRYKATANFDIDDGDGSGPWNGHLASHNVQVGLTFKF